MSKRGHCSRSEGERLVRAGRVRVDGRIVRDPEHRTGEDARIEVDDAGIAQEAFRYLALNKPRGLVTTRHDPEGRPTVYSCLDGLDLPHVAPVGRLDRASEGLLLFTNDTGWASAVLEGDGAPLKRYHVQIDRAADERLLAVLTRGAEDRGERLAAREARLLRTGTRNAWLEIVLDEGRNRHIRRLLQTQGVEVLRLVRVAIGSLALGDLAKGSVRDLTVDEVRMLGRGN
nr:pseudouridine synthase [Aureimonas jatrophae]